LLAKNKNGKKNAFTAAHYQPLSMALSSRNRVIYAKIAVVSFMTGKYCLRKHLFTIIFLASRQN